MNNTYKENKTISYFQIDTKQEMTPSALLSDLQEAAINHSDKLGYSVEKLTEMQKGWAVINWHLKIERLPKLKEKITIQTWCAKCRHMQAIRCFYIFDENENVIATAISRWVFMDLEKRKPSNITEEMIEKYHSDEEICIKNEKFIMPKDTLDEFFSKRLKLIKRRDTDTNGHANNVKYLEWAIDDIPDEIYDNSQLNDIKIVYRKECLRGETVKIKSSMIKTDTETEILCFITDENDTILAEVVTNWI